MVRGRARFSCAALALAANVALFAYWLCKIVAFKRNPIMGVLYCALSEFRSIVREHCDGKDKYFLVDRIPETHEELGFEPDSPTPPADGYRTWMPWWRGEDRRHPSKRGAGSPTKVGLCSSMPRPPRVVTGRPRFCARARSRVILWRGCLGVVDSLCWQGC